MARISSIKKAFSSRSLSLSVASLLFAAQIGAQTQRPTPTPTPAPTATPNTPGTMDAPQPKNPNTSAEFKRSILPNKGVAMGRLPDPGAVSNANTPSCSGGRVYSVPAASCICPSGSWNGLWCVTVVSVTPPPTPTPTPTPTLPAPPPRSLQCMYHGTYDDGTPIGGAGGSACASDADCAPSTIGYNNIYPGVPVVMTLVGCG